MGHSQGQAPTNNNPAPTRTTSCKPPKQQTPPRTEGHDGVRQPHEGEGGKARVEEVLVEGEDRAVLHPQEPRAEALVLGQPHGVLQGPRGAPEEEGDVVLVARADEHEVHPAQHAPVRELLCSRARGGGGSCLRA